MRHGILAGILAGIFLLGLAPTRAGGQAFDDQKVADAIEKAKKLLLSAQLPDGSWSKDKPNNVGITAMCTYALIECGVKPSQDNVKKALAWLTEQKCTHTYSLGLRCQAYLAAEKRGSRGAYKALLRKDAEILVKAGLTNAGKYGYTTPGPGSDNSNTQYGLLGVWAAAQLGTIEIPETYWERVAKHWQACQGPDGGWQYPFARPAVGGSAPTMTVAGLASVLVCYEQLTTGSFADCRGPTQAPAVENGLDWMERYFVEIVGGTTALQAARELEAKRKAQETEDTKKVLDELSPAERQRFLQEETKRLAEDRKRQRPAGEARGFTAVGGWMYYFLYGVERVGLASGYKYFGTADWYKLGAEYLTKAQGADGGWGQLYDTAFAMIYLVRGRHPVLFNKLAYRGRWRNRPHDLANLAKWISDNSEWTVNWQSINPNVPVKDWHDAPILYIAGSTAPYFTPAEIAKLRRFVEEGGTILSVAECNAAEFKAGIRLAYQKIFPQYELTALKPDHEMNTSLALLPIPSATMPPVFAIANGVRPLAVHIESDLPKFWQMRRARSPESVFEIGANVSQYIAGLAKDLRPRGASPWPDRTPNPLTGKDVRLVRVKHAGNWDAEPLAYDRFSLLMANRQRLNVIVAPPVEATGLAADKVHLAVLAGTGRLVLTGPETDALRAFVHNGGTILVEALGGNEDFARSARTVLTNVFGAPPERLEPTHPLYQVPAREVTQFRYRRKTQRRLGHDSGPAIEAIAFQDRPAVFFSREDISTALLGYQGMAVDGYLPETAFEVVRNIALLASGQAPTSRPASGPSSQPASAPAGPRVDVKGEYVNPNKELAQGKLANMTGETTLGWQTATCALDVLTNGFTLTVNSGDGNPLCYTGAIYGTGNVVLLSGPATTNHKDEPLRLAGDKPNAATGTFFVRKGRVQLEKPDGVDAISGDVTVGGQGANDCLHWLASNQINDAATITLLSASDKDGAYLSLNGFSEAVAGLVMGANTLVKTDSPAGQSGVLTVKSLTINGAVKPAGAYTAATDKWIEGKGKVVVAP